MNPGTLLTSAARRHLRLLAQAVDARAGTIQKSLLQLLRERRYDAVYRRELLAITPLAAARTRGLGRFLESAEEHGRRLAQLNMALEEAVELLAGFGCIVDEVLEGAHAPAREQLQLVTAQALQRAYYQVRESEAQMFYGLAHAEAASESVDALLQRVAGILARGFGARTGRLVLLGAPPAGKLSRRLCAQGSVVGWDLPCCWSVPVRSVGLIQLGFAQLRRWLPRERNLLEAMAERCAAAVERARLNESVGRLQAEARQAEEQERRRIGRELHDDTAQSLLLLRLQLEMLERDAPPGVKARLEQSRGIAEKAIEDLRRTIAALSPAVLERLGLESALRQLAARFAKQNRAEMNVWISRSCLEIPAASQPVFYRVAQECLQNISRHSRATRVNLRLSSTDKVFRLSVGDNGAGFHAESALSKPMSFGLTGMRERAALLGGRLAVRSFQGKGATVTLELPRASTTGEN